MIKEMKILIDLNELREKVYRSDDMKIIDGFARIVPVLKRYEYVKTDYGYILKEEQ